MLLGITAVAQYFQGVLPTLFAGAVIDLAPAGMVCGIEVTVEANQRSFCSGFYPFGNRVAIYFVTTGL
ncbi:hypothetical protein D3C85_1530480 [compost metagenome]